MVLDVQRELDIEEEGRIEVQGLLAASDAVEEIEVVPGVGALLRILHPAELSVIFGINARDSA